MKLLPTQTDEASLLQLGREVVALLEKGDFQSLADCFGYALAFGRNPAFAIEEDLRFSIATLRASSERPPVAPSMIVNYFQHNDSGLFAVVECVLATSEGCPILAELIVTSAGENRYISLEEFSAAPAFARPSLPNSVW